MKNPLKSTRPRAGRKGAERIERQTHSFTRFVAARARDPGKRKGARTRDSLKSAAVELLETRGYRDLRVTDISVRAGVSNGLFYVYFKDKNEITQEVLSEFLEALFAPRAAGARPQTIEESIYRANVEYVRRFAANPGLMRCILQFGDEIPEFGKLWRSFNARWVERVTKSLAAEPALAATHRADVWATVASLGTMIDGLLRQLYVEREPVLREQVRAVAPDDEALAWFVTKLWVRALFSRDLNNTRTALGDSRKASRALPAVRIPPRGTRGAKPQGGTGS